MVQGHASGTLKDNGVVGSSSLALRRLSVPMAFSEFDRDVQVPVHTRDNDQLNAAPFQLSLSSDETADTNGCTVEVGSAPSALSLSRTEL